ncbi:hypothetical protein [Terrarubrum flagellatum]|uniref:hypothetical protein n=1 Tax=Terrirubrum flagellatum TaxID=2895980 RepID=UPI00314517CB
MRADWYFLLALIGPIIGLLLVIVAIPLAIYSLCARNARRGLKTSKAALVLSALSILLSVILWIELMTGRFRNGDPVNYGDPDFIFYEVVAILEVVALSISLLGVIRQKARSVS